MLTVSTFAALVFLLAQPDENGGFDCAGNVNCSEGSGESDAPTAPTAPPTPTPTPTPTTPPPTQPTPTTTPAQTMAEDARKIGIAVLDLQAGAGLADAASTVNGLVSTELERGGVFRVVTQDDIRQLVSFDQMKSALSCDEQASCLAEIGSALGVPYMLTGSVSKPGSDVVVGVALIDISSARAVKRETQTYASVDALIAAVPQLVARVVADILYRAQGTLVVRCREAGAVVEVDGVAIGTTPLDGHALAAGPRRVRVSKPGFIAWVSDVSVLPSSRAVVDAKLRLTPELVDDLRARASLAHTLAWGGVVGAVVCVVGGVGAVASTTVWVESERAKRGLGATTPLAVDPATGATINAATTTGYALLATAPIAAAAGAWGFATAPALDEQLAAQGAEPSP